MKGVVLSGGSGTRLRPITFSMPKQLVPVANQPILHFGLKDMAAAGITEVAIIISPETGDVIRASVGDGAELGLEVTYIVQDEPLGLAHALGCALPWVDGDDVLMYLGDNIVKRGVTDVMEDYLSNDANCQILLTEVENPQEFGIAELDDQGNVRRVVEKPNRPKSNLAVVGVYLFDAMIAETIEAIRPSPRGELEITDAIQYLVDHDGIVNASIVRGWWKDTGRKEDLLHANELVLRDLEPDVRGEVLGGSIRGPVAVDESARLVDCDLTGPCVIGPHVELYRTMVGPNTSIGARTSMADCSVEGSILLEDVSVYGWKLRSSLIGRETRLHGSSPAGFVELMLGERCEVLGA